MSTHQDRIETALLADDWDRVGYEASEWARALETAGEKDPRPYFALNVTHLIRGEFADAWRVYARALQETDDIERVREWVQSIADRHAAVEVKHPGELNGRRVIPELKRDTWSVLAADVRDEVDAVRLAAIISHQGPPIPARVISKNPGYHVIAGPFNDIREAKDAIKRLKIDLEIDGILIEPVKKR